MKEGKNTKHSNVNLDNECPFCNKKFKRVVAYEKHLKECIVVNKLLLLDIDDRAFVVWMMINPKIQNTFEEKLKFAKSRNFMYLVNFFLETDEKNWKFQVEYVEWLLNNKISFNSWLADKLYNQFLRFHINREYPKDALTRSLEFIISKGYNGNFFSTVPVRQAIGWIEVGEISPWLIFVYEKSTDLFERMTEEELDYVSKFINPDAWYSKIQKYTKTFESMKTMIKGIEI